MSDTSSSTTHTQARTESNTASLVRALGVKAAQSRVDTQAVIKNEPKAMQTFLKALDHRSREGR